MPSQASDQHEAALREIRSYILDLKDDVITRLLRYKTLDTMAAQRLALELGRFDLEELAAQMEEVLSRYARWSFERGVGMIQAALREVDLPDILRIPDGATIDDQVLELARVYDPSAIRSIGTELLPDVQRYITLAILGQRTPQEISEQISKRFDVAQRKADTIVRTEIKRQQNRGSEAMIQRTIPQAQEIGLRMERLWIHSSGRQDEGSAKGKHRVRYEPRPHHKAMHGVGVDASMKFTLRNAETGGTWFVDGPHDPVLPAGEVVNCYCDRVLRISRESIALLNEERAKADRLRKQRSATT